MPIAAGGRAHDAWLELLDARIAAALGQALAASETPQAAVISSLESRMKHELLLMAHYNWFSVVGRGQYDIC